MTNHWVDIKNADVILIMGSNAAENHPVAFKWIEEARKKNRFGTLGYPPATVISVDPRFTRSSSKADIYAPMRSGTDIAFLGGMIRYAIKKWVDSGGTQGINQKYVEDCTNALFKVRTDFVGARDASHPGDFSASSTWDYDYETDASWILGTPYALDALVKSNIPNNYQYKCTVAGTSGGSEPVWPTTIGGTVLDGGVTWTCILPIKRPKKAANLNAAVSDSATVFYKLKEHYSVYTPEMVEKICGTPQELFLDICEAYCDGTCANDKSATMLYAMGWTQHTVGSQNIRAATILQSLLGNMGVAGGGINALRGWHNVQGATDHAVLFHYIPGYNASPQNIAAHAKLGTGPEDATDTYLKKTIPLAIDPDAPTNPSSSNWWGRFGTQYNRGRYVVSNLKAWWPTINHNISWSYLPKRAADYSYLSLMKAIDNYTIKGLFCWGTNPMVMGPDQNLENSAMDKLEWLVVCDLFHTETSDFWQRPGAPASNTDVYLLPGAAFFEKEGSVANSGRLSQWKDPACIPPKPTSDPTYPDSGARDELDILNDLGTAIKGLYSVTPPATWVLNTAYVLDDLVQPTAGNNGAQYKCTAAGNSGGGEPTWPTNLGDTVVDNTVTWTCVNLLNAGITNLAWPVGSLLTGTLVQKVAKEVNGYALVNYTSNFGAVAYTQGDQINNFFHLNSGGESACGNWLYCGTWQKALNTRTSNYNQMKNRRAIDDHPQKIGIYRDWGYSWPVNRRIIYNRAAVFQSGGSIGNPLAPLKQVVKWTGANWDGGCGAGQANDVIDGFGTAGPGTWLPYIMREEGVARLMGIKALADGPFPEHWEPKETPLTVNPLTKTEPGGPGPLSSPYLAAQVAQYGATYAPAGWSDIVCTTYRLSEHWHGGGMSRNLPTQVELMPEPFIEMSEELAADKGISNGDNVIVTSARGSITLKACVTMRFKTYTIDGQTVHHVGMPWHWGWVGNPKTNCSGPSANVLTPYIGDANTRIPETKAFLVKIVKA